jgi:hypothetical protein
MALPYENLLKVSKPRPPVRSLLLAGLLLLIALPGPTPAAGRLALVHAALPPQTSPSLVTSLGLTVLAEVSPHGGPVDLILLINPAQRRALRQAGIALRVLDTDPLQGEYWLVHLSHMGSAGDLESTTEVLWAREPVALVRASGVEIDRLAAAGLQVQGLHPHLLAAGQSGPTPAAPAAFSPSADIQVMMAQVDQASLQATIEALSGESQTIIRGQPYTLRTRYSRTDIPITRATQYGRERLEGLGLLVDYDYYQLPGSGERRSVIANQPGVLAPQRVYMLIAHLDDTSQDPYNLAPGADDNASGSAGLLAAAEILSQYAFGCTMRYALFTGEEQGQYGSTSYAASVAQSGDRIEGVLNLDMIGYNGDMLPEVELHVRKGNAGDRAIADLFKDVVSAYGLTLAPRTVADGLSFSDHAPFWSLGIPGVLAVEDWDSDRTPAYHTTADRLSTLDLAFTTEIVRGAVGTMAHLGCGLQRHRSYLPFARRDHAGQALPSPSPAPTSTSAVTPAPTQSGG